MKQLALILAAVFVIIAILYWTGHFIPAGVHLKHGIVSVILALLCLVWYRFQSAETTR
jgi:ABC-type transport system involved in cytochrome bd biosynthesis fused ATPase/permease subunit